MKRLAALALAAAATLSLAACGGPDHGTIVGKSYSPSYVFYQQTCYSYASNGTCKISIPTPVTEPAHYYLKLQDGSSTGNHEVDQTTYDHAQIGSSY